MLYWRYYQVPHAPDYDAGVRTLSPTAFWACDEASGNLADSSGNGWTATVAGSHTYQQTGPVINGEVTAAIDLGGTSSDRFTTSTSFPNCDINGMSWSVWVKTPAIGATARVLNRMATGQLAWSVGFDSSGTFTFQAWSAGDVNIIDRRPAEVDNDAWRHLVVLWDEANDDVHMIIDDGTPSSNTSITGPMLSTSTAAVVIGAGTVGGTDPYGGLIAKPAIWNRVLTAGEITKLKTGIF